MRGARRRAAAPRHVGQRAVARHHGVHGAAGCRHDLRDDRHRRAARLQTGQVERHRPQRAGRRVDEMAARHVVGVTAAAHEDRARPGLQVQDRHLRGIEAARHRRDREQHGPAARQQLRPEVIGFALRAVGPREDRRRPARRRDPLQAGRPLLVATMIVSSGPQVAPRGPPSSVASVTAGPPVTATFFNTVRRPRTRSIGHRGRRTARAARR